MITYTRNGTTIPALGLGTFDLIDDCANIVNESLAVGYRHIDAAAMYGNEELVGTGVKDSTVPRDHIFLTTKLNTYGKYFSSEGWYDFPFFNSNIVPEVEASLTKLQTDYVDLLLIHWPMFETTVFDVLEPLYKLKAQGKVRQVGLSNFNSALLKELDIGRDDIFCNQVEHSPYVHQHTLHDTMKELGIIPTAYCPMYRGEVANDSVLRHIASTHNKTPTQIALRWLVQRGWCAIPKASNIKRLEENISIFDFELSDSDIVQINMIKERSRLCPNTSDYEFD
tara:strand:+ start:1524 stop:2369 length:846 start_codon:yes stop_codon:yes gene_type:complete